MENNELKRIEKWTCTSEKLWRLIEKLQLQIILSIIENEIWPIKDYYDNIIVENIIRKIHTTCKLIGYDYVEYICFNKKILTIKFNKDLKLIITNKIKDLLVSIEWIVIENENIIVIEIDYSICDNYSYHNPSI